jgi:hypothetical protein
LVEAVADIQVGVDLSRVQPNDIRVDGDKISVTLPHAEIMSIELRPEGTSVHELSGPLFAGCDNMEIEALNKARQQLRDETLRNPHALIMAERLATEQLTEFLNRLGFSQVEITFK